MDLRLYFLQKKARKLGVKINDISCISHTASIQAESPCSLGSAEIVNRKLKTSLLLFGAHSYIRSGTLHNVSRIGRFCSFGQNVTIGQLKKTHPIDFASTSRELCLEYEYSAPPAEVGHDVWIGDGAVIMEGVKIGHGAVIGKNALVTKDVLPYQIVGGNPAKPIRFRFEPSIIEALLVSEWWNLDLAEMRKLDYQNVTHFLAQVKAIDKHVHYQQVKITRQQVSGHSP